MSERLTKRDRYGHAYTNETVNDRGMTSKDGVNFEKHYFENGTSAYDGKPIDRLCEIEDKIEQGKIVELPCAVGSEAYHLTSADTLDKRIKQAKKKRIEAYRKDSVQGIVYWDGYLDALKAVKEDKENERR